MLVERLQAYQPMVQEFRLNYSTNLNLLVMMLAATVQVLRLNHSASSDFLEALAVKEQVFHPSYSTNPDLLVVLAAKAKTHRMMV